ncbi:MAG: glycoside hydrolase family 3 N-terminal domain-containing protein [Rikenellaceae bacterium]
MDPSQPVEKRVESLLSQMTFEEKVAQLNILVMGKSDNANNTEDREGRKLSPETGAFIYFGTNVDSANEIQRRAVEQSRLGIPALLGHDVIHGYRTLFPMPLAQACSWNRDLIYGASRVAAKESYLSGLRWTFSPMLDVAIDGRWGRVAESYGEDPYVNSEYARLVVSGYQGGDLSDEYSIAACLKHFAGYAYSQGGRDYNPTDVSDLSLWERVLPPFHAAVETGAATVMSSFNDLNGVPTVANKMLLTDILRERWGFDGFVVSDWRSIEQLITQRYAADSLHATALAINAGNDMDMYDYLYARHLAEAVESGAVSMETVDEAVRRILRVKFRLGLFENPYTEVVADDRRYMEPESVELAKELAQQSMVLLKNNNNRLPLSSGVKSVLLVGPMVNDRINMMGTWRSHARESDVTTIYDALVAEFGDRVNFTYLDGVSFLKNDSGFIERFKREAKGVDLVIAAMGEQYAWSGENGSRASLELPPSQVKVIDAANEVGVSTLLLTSSGRPLALSNVVKKVDAIVHMWQPGLYGGDAVAAILSGRVNPSGRLAITFPFTTGQVPIFYNHRPNARAAWGKGQGGYRDVQREPLYEFGYGLSYTEYEYSDLKATKSSFSRGESIEVSVDVKNIGERDGMESVLWYVDDPVASVTQPVKRLSYFEKREVKAGEVERFSFTIDPMRDLSFVNSRGERVLESGEYVIIVGDKRISLELLD